MKLLISSTPSDTTRVLLCFHFGILHRICPLYELFSFVCVGSVQKLHFTNPFLLFFLMNTVSMIEELLLQFYFISIFLLIMNSGKKIPLWLQTCTFFFVPQSSPVLFYSLISLVSSNILTNWILRELTFFSLVPLGSTRGSNKEICLMHSCILAINMNAGVTS